MKKETMERGRKEAVEMNVVHSGLYEINNNNIIIMIIIIIKLSPLQHNQEIVLRVRNLTTLIFSEIGSGLFDHPHTN